jgi:hypothetical protein
VGLEFKSFPFELKGRDIDKFESLDKKLMLLLFITAFILLFVLFQIYTINNQITFLNCEILELDKGIQNAIVLQEELISLKKEILKLNQELSLKSKELELQNEIIENILKKKNNSLNNLMIISLLFGLGFGISYLLINSNLFIPGFTQMLHTINLSVIPNLSCKLGITEGEFSIIDENGLNYIVKIAHNFSQIYVKNPDGSLTNLSEFINRVTIPNLSVPVVDMAAYLTPEMIQLYESIQLYATSFV